MIVTLLLICFLLKLIKIPCYGMISLEYDRNDERLITPQNALKLNIQYKTTKGNITLQLENVLNPKNF